MAGTEKCRVLIIECKDRDDPGSEGRFIYHMLKIMEQKPTYRMAEDRSDFISLLAIEGPKYDIVHIATHGVDGGSDKHPKFSGFWTPSGMASLKRIEQADVDLSKKTVISTACFSGQKGAASGFKKAVRCKHYIAPVGGPAFRSAALMCHIVYHKHLTLERSLKSSFAEYDNRYKNPHEFTLV